jgi:uncharacterized membrane protein YbhN (UPF0104 family)
MDMKQFFRKIIRILLPLALGIILLCYLYRNQDPGEIMQVVKKGVRYDMILFSLIFGLAANTVRGLRWSMLIDSLGKRVSRKNAICAIWGNYAINMALPRVGEIWRCGVMSKYEKIPFMKLLGTLFVDRVMDTLVVALLTLCLFVFNIDFFRDFFSENPPAIIAAHEPVPAGTGDCFASYLATPCKDAFRHCEQSEAIHAHTPDCFASYLATPRNDDIIRHCEQSEAIHARTPDCFASYLATPRNDDIIRHCERSEAIHARTLDCFVPRNDELSFRPDEKLCIASNGSNRPDEKLCIASIGSNRPDEKLCIASIGSKRPDGKLCIASNGSKRPDEKLCIASIESNLPDDKLCIASTGSNLPGVFIATLHALASSAWTYVGLLILAAAGWFVFMKLKHLAIVKKIAEMLGNVWEGVKSLWKIEHKAQFFLQTLLIWVGYFLYFYITFFAFDFTRDLGIRIALIAFTMSSLGVAVPVQGGIGVWHFMVISTLVAFGVDKSDAGAFAMVVFAIQTVWVILTGLVGIAALPVVNKNAETEAEG